MEKNAHKDAQGARMTLEEVISEAYREFLIEKISERAVMGTVTFNEDEFFKHIATAVRKAGYVKPPLMSCHYCFREVDDDDIGSSFTGFETIAVHHDVCKECVEGMAANEN